MKKSFLPLMSSLVCVMVIGGCLVYASKPDTVRGFIISKIAEFWNACAEISENETEIVQTDGSFTASSRTVQVNEENGIIVELESDADENVISQDEPANAYSYNMLTKEEQNVYMEILRSLLEFEENSELSSVDSDEIARVFQCVLNDHPEIFYINGYNYTQYTLADIPQKFTFTGAYNMDRDEVEEKQELINDYVNICLAGIPQDADEYEKVKYIYEYLIEHTEYDADAENSQNICSVFIDGRSVCQGYAKAAQYLLKRLGIDSSLVLGKVPSGEGHAWNVVKIDGEWYHVDATWGDASYRTKSGEAIFEEEKLPAVNYDYLCVTTEQINRTHVIDNVVELPQCTSMEANYYIREGLYFTDIDEEKLVKIFDDGYDSGRAYVTLKCASNEIYDKMYEKLITNQEIFRYLECPDGVVSYTDNDIECSMSFWL